MFIDNLILQLKKRKERRSLALSYFLNIEEETIKLHEFDHKLFEAYAKINDNYSKEDLVEIIVLQQQCLYQSYYLIRILKRRLWHF